MLSCIFCFGHCTHALVPYSDRLFDFLNVTIFGHSCWNGGKSTTWSVVNSKVLTVCQPQWLNSTKAPMWRNQNYLVIPNVATHIYSKESFDNMCCVKKEMPATYLFPIPKVHETFFAAIFQSLIFQDSFRLTKTFAHMFPSLSMTGKKSNQFCSQARCSFKQVQGYASFNGLCSLFLIWKNLKKRATRSKQASQTLLFYMRVCTWRLGRCTAPFL